MSVNWIDALKPIAGKLAIAGLPTLGNIVGDLIPFPGGAIAGRLAGEWAAQRIAEALGVPPTPEAITGAVETMPAGELNARLAAAENEAAEKWDAMARIAEADAADRTAQSKAVNATIGKELGKVSWWHWRHLIGYVLVGLGGELLALLPLVVLGKITAGDVTAIITAITPVVFVFAGLLGYVAQDTTRQKITAATGEAPPTPLATVAATVRAATGKMPAAPVVPRAPAAQPKERHGVT